MIYLTVQIHTVSCNTSFINRNSVHPLLDSCENPVDRRVSRNLNFSSDSTHPSPSRMTTQFAISFANVCVTISYLGNLAYTWQCAIVRRFTVACDKAPLRKEYFRSGLHALTVKVEKRKGQRDFDTIVVLMTLALSIVCIVLHYPCIVYRIFRNPSRISIYS